MKHHHVSQSYYESRFWRVGHSSFYFLTPLNYTVMSIGFFIYLHDLCVHTQHYSYDELCSWA